MDQRWQYGVPPAGNANFAWVQHMIYHLAPTGWAGFLLANGSMSSNQPGEGEIHKHIVEADLVLCMLALPGQLFYSTQIPACLWFLARDKSGKSPSSSLEQDRGGSGRFRDRRGQVLFIDARKLGRMVDRTHRVRKSAKRFYASVPNMARATFGCLARWHAAKPRSRAISISSSNSIRDEACSTTRLCGLNCRIYSGATWTC